MNFIRCWKSYVSKGDYKKKKNKIKEIENEQVMTFFKRPFSEPPYISHAKIGTDNRDTVLRQFRFEECRFKGGARGQDILAILELSKCSITKDINPFTVARHAPCAPKTFHATPKEYLRESKEKKKFVS